jgi:hypothetical protein
VLGISTLITFAVVLALELTSSLRGASGSRECAPDDRLRDEAIQPCPF